jgi:hypothetical protein
MHDAGVIPAAFTGGVDACERRSQHHLSTDCAAFRGWAGSCGTCAAPARAATPARSPPAPATIHAPRFSKRALPSNRFGRPPITAQRSSAPNMVTIDRAIGGAHVQQELLCTDLLSTAVAPGLTSALHLTSISGTGIARAHVQHDQDAAGSRTIQARV